MNWIKPDWPAANNIHAAVTLRTGGLSQGVYRSLNLASHVHDAPETVRRNRQAISKMLNLPSQPVWLEQMHGNRVVKADQVTQVEQADASYTDQANIICAILTADCLPILLAGSDGIHIAAIHAGWRGLLAGVISNTVESLGTINTIAWLGPAIGSACFEIGIDVRTAFVNKSIKFSSAFLKINKDKYLADIYQLATIELAMSGINQVYGGDFCTVSDKERFYSYRRDGKTGRMATLIWRD
jgi:YfiH family protein